MKKNLLYGLQKKNGSMVTQRELYGAVNDDYDIREKLLDLARIRSTTPEMGYGP